MRDFVYRGRLAPTPTGYLHLGHARTFWVAQQRAKANDGILILRNDDLDRARCKPEFVRAMTEDLRWFGLEWQEGPDVGGLFGPYNQSERFSFYRAALEKLRAGNFIYPCTCSRRDIQSAVTAPHAADDEEPIYPGTCRDRFGSIEEARHAAGREPAMRFRVPAGEVVFEDQFAGMQRYDVVRDLGDFVIAKADGTPAYQLAVVVDDSDMNVSHIVRGDDLLEGAHRVARVSIPGVDVALDARVEPGVEVRRELEQRHQGAICARRPEAAAGRPGAGRAQLHSLPGRRLPGPDA